MLWDDLGTFSVIFGHSWKPISALVQNVGVKKKTPREKKHLSKVFFSSLHVDVKKSEVSESGVIFELTLCLRIYPVALVT